MGVEAIAVIEDEQSLLGGASASQLSAGICNQPL